MKTQIVAINSIPGGKIIEGVERKKTVGECSDNGMVREGVHAGELYIIVS